jgi:hypothetical protein
MAESSPFVNHVEMIFRPGERGAARKLFESLGFGVGDHGPWLVVSVDPATGNGVDNVFYASEPIPAQQTFEDALAKALCDDPAATAAREHYEEVRLAHPQYSFHFGVSMDSQAGWQERTDRIREAAANDPLLKGRVEVSVFLPGDPGSVGNVYQAFVLTDILSTGTMQTGLILEVQFYPRNESGEIDGAELFATSTPLDPKTLV